MQSNKQKNLQSVPTLQTPSNVKVKTWVGVNLARISFSYIGIIIVGLTTFYFAKKEIEGERQKQMKIKQEINKPSNNYPNRHDLIKAEKEALALAKNQ